MVDVVVSMAERRARAALQPERTLADIERDAEVYADKWFAKAMQLGLATPASTATSSTIKAKRQKPSEFATIEPREWIVDDVLPAGAGLVLVYGESTAGKSYWLLDLLAAISRGAAWRGLETKRTPVLSVVAEGARDYRFRMRALAQHLGCELDELPDVYAAAPDLLNDEQFRHLLAEVRPGEIVTIDTLNATMLGDENASEAMGRYIARCKQIHDRTRAPVIVLHHPGKDAKKGARGHSSLRAAVDVEIEISKVGQQRCARVTKFKDGADGGSYAFELQHVALGVDERGKPYGAAIVKHMESKRGLAKLAEPKGAVALLILQTAREHMPSEGMERARLVELVAPMIDGKRQKEKVDAAITRLLSSGHLHDLGNRSVSLVRVVTADFSDRDDGAQ